MNFTVNRRVRGRARLTRFAATGYSQRSIMKREWITDALRIRRVEETFLRLFAEGRLNGTVHTCIGQEFSALAFAGGLRPGDAVVSNHRCHGHYLAFTGDLAGLVAELTGKAAGVCGGIGSSQHLCRDGFFSNGIQGGTAPVAAGLAMARKLRGGGDIAVVFLGDGTLGEGVVYEVLNMASKWELPLLLVCERNRYAQSTPTERTIAGDILARAEAFAIPTFHSATADPDALMADAARSIRQVRETGRPAFHLVETNRLAPHSKGDDDRDPAELAACRAQDPLCRLEAAEPDTFSALAEAADREIRAVLDGLEGAPALAPAEYARVADPDPAPRWVPAEPSERRQADLLHACLAERMAANPETLLLGEDIAAPYGGAFKITRDLSDRFPGRVVSTPISEAGFTGIGCGLALGGFRPVVEIMFGDFVLLALDQLVNHASKFHHMYNGRATCPLILRTPMGGGRGYGPTHSQSLEKFLAGIDNVVLCALNSLVDPALIYKKVFEREHPTVVVEHKLDYGRRIAARTAPGYVAERTAGGWPWARVRPRSSRPDVTLVTHGGMADAAVAALAPLFRDHGVKAELLVPSRLCPLDARPILDSTAVTGRLVTIEEGSGFAGIGAEVAAVVAERSARPVRVRRIAAEPLPIPSVRELEDRVLPTTRSIIRTVSEFLS